jgi:hypothetical protein
MAQSSGEQLERAPGAAPAERPRANASQLAAAERQAADRAVARWEGLQRSQAQQVEALRGLQSAMVQQGDVLARAVEASGQVTRLQDALNRNLGALAGAKNFEQTVMSLAAAIHLLNARLADGPAREPAVDIESPTRSPKAA